MPSPINFHVDVFTGYYYMNSTTVSYTCFGRRLACHISELLIVEPTRKEEKRKKR